MEFLHAGCIDGLAALKIFNRIFAGGMILCVIFWRADIDPAVVTRTLLGFTISVCCALLGGLAIRGVLRCASYHGQRQSV